ncbi:MAG TPA: hypothetical protein VKY65_17140 [Alphaproteobacteria bacterium]|nr:hypothetical protein [Alphaproteobacteria bacterium]
MAESASQKLGRQSLTYDEIVTITGPIEPVKIAEIMAAQPQRKELEEAVAWAAGDSDSMGKLRRPLVGTVAHLYEILTAERGSDEPE